jgi:hypothetical protein
MAVGIDEIAKLLKVAIGLIETGEQIAEGNVLKPILAEIPDLISLKNVDFAAALAEIKDLDLSEIADLNSLISGNLKLDHAGAQAKVLAVMDALLKIAQAVQALVAVVKG